VASSPFTEPIYGNSQVIFTSYVHYPALREVSGKFPVAGYIEGVAAPWNGVVDVGFLRQ
jgi:hypothetical protein